MICPKVGSVSGSRSISSHKNQVEKDIIITKEKSNFKLMKVMFTNKYYEIIVT